MFLLQNDFKKQIQDQNLNIVTGLDGNILNSVAETAVVEMTGYLTARYRCDLIFADIFDYNNFDNYSVGQRVLHNGLLYTPISTDPTQTVPPNNEPPPIYNPNASYNIGDKVLYMPYNKQYVCTTTTNGNPPSDPNFWATSTPQYWQQRDTRDPLILTYCIDIALYHLHSRINPRQIPELRQTRYEQAIRWLREVNAQKVNPHLPEHDAGDAENTGHDYILFGGNRRRNLQF